MSEQCKNCGAEIEYQPGSQSLICPYCNTLNEIKRPEDELPTEVDLIIPLSTNQKDLENQVYTFLAEDNYAPDDIIQSATFLKRERFYVPAYLFKIDYQAEWTASFGYDRKEPYTDYKTVNGRRQAYTAYRTVTDWRPVNGTDANTFEVSIYAGTDLTSLTLTPAEMIPSIIANAERTAFNPDFMQGVTAESFAIPEKLAFDSLSEEINENIDHNVKQHAQGDRQRDWHWTLSHIESSTGTLFVPICNAVFDYKGNNYSYWCDGIGNGNIVADKLPVDSNRERNVYLGFIPTLASFCALLLVWGIGSKGGFALRDLWSILGLLLALGYAFLRRNFILDYSKSIRKSFLNQKKAFVSSIESLSDGEKQAYAQAFQPVEKPFLAKTEYDKIVLPVLSIFFFLVTASLPDIFRDLSQSENAKTQHTQTTVVKKQQQTANQQVNYCVENRVMKGVFEKEKDFINNELISKGYRGKWRFTIQAQETADSMGGPEFKCTGVASVLSGDSGKKFMSYNIAYSMSIDEGDIGIETNMRSNIQSDLPVVPQTNEVQEVDAESQEQQQQLNEQERQRRLKEQEQQRQLKEQEQQRRLQKQERQQQKQKNIKLKDVFNALKSIKREGPVEVNPTD
ncbi:MAG: hypothetical protein NC112_03750 [Oxalobacter formigenes]|nr:hypothetical protein [Oxalobacter formigenes]